MGAAKPRRNFSKEFKKNAVNLVTEKGLPVDRELVTCCISGGDNSLTRVTMHL
jgi:transposase-like protein